VATKLARTLSLLLLLALGFGLAGAPTLPTGPAAARPWTSAARTPSARVVFLAGGLSDDRLVALTATVAASGRSDVVLLDSAAATPFNKDFLVAYRPERIVPVGSFPDGVADLERRLGVTTESPLVWKRGQPAGLWKALFPQAERVVVCPAQPRSDLLQAACLAGALPAPLFVLRGEAGEAADLARWIGEWKTTEIYAVGHALKPCRALTGPHIVRLPDAEATAACYLRHQLKRGPIRTLVVANPADTKNDLGSMSNLAPWVALQRHAALLLTGDAGDNTETVVRAALREPHLARADALILVAGLEAIPMERRPNPVPGKDPYIEMEPLTPHGNEPYSFATGRLFNQDPGIVLLQLARRRILAERHSARKALVVSNPAGGLPLLEAFSRNTAKEFGNTGYDTTTLFGKEVTRDDVRRLLPENDIFLWEGHHNTLINDYAMPEWNEPMVPSLVFLQSCLALTEGKAQPLLQRGAVGVVGSSTRTYSGSGGAFALAYFNALLYDDQSLGGSLRQAKNFLLAYTLLKEKRLGKDARLNGVNLRSAWAFTLWGDPTLRLPRPRESAEALAPVRHEVHGNTIIVRLPATAYPKVTTGKYQTAMRPNARMAGLLSGQADADGRHFVPFVFAEVHLPRAPPGQTPQVRTRLPGKQWVFCYDRRRQCGYLLVTPRPKDQHELRFHLDWGAAGEVSQAARPD
jgi:hypothetical protein